MCLRKYPGHPKGCPNFNKKETCPPYAPLFDRVHDMSMPVYAIINRFDIGEHVAKMKNLHPNWSDRQLSCSLYWQPRARKQIKTAMKEFLEKNPQYNVTLYPEAMAVDVEKTLRQINIELEWPPLIYAYQVAIAYVKSINKRSMFG